jgi:transcriptional regulator with XRE-family HTH domain
MNIGERLKLVRELYGHSQAKVAGAIGVKPVTYQAYERNRAETPLRVLLALSEFYGFHSIDLLLNLRTETEFRTGVMDSYLKASWEKRKIVDFVLSLNN